MLRQWTQIGVLVVFIDFFIVCSKDMIILEKKHGVIGKNTMDRLKAGDSG